MPPTPPHGPFATDPGSDGRGDESLAAARDAEQTIEDLESGRAALLSRAREAAGPDSSYRNFRSVVGASEGGWYLLVALAVFLAADQVLGYVLSVLAPQIQGALGLSPGQYTLIVSQRSNAAMTLALAYAYHLQRRPGDRKTLAVYAVVASGIGAIISAFFSSFWPLFLAIGVTAPTAGALWSVHRPMVMDNYRPGVRVRTVSILQAGVVGGSVIGPAVLGLLWGVAGLSWRGVLVAIGAASIVIAVLGGLRIRDAGVGRYDTVPIQTALRSDLRSEGAPDGGGEDEALGYLETLQRVWLVPTMRRLLAAWAVLGIVITPLPTYLGFLLEDRWGLTTAGRAVFLAGTWACALPALAFFGARGDARLRSGPARLVSLAPPILVAMAVGLLLGAVAPSVPVAFVGFGIALAMSGALVPVLAVTTMAVVEPRARPHAMALAAIFQLGVGGLGGAELLGGLNNRFGNGLAIGILVIPTLVAALLVRRAAVTADADMDRVVGDVVEQEEVAAIVHHGHHLPLLACRHIDFAYGQLQVLFDVNLTVDEGEIVALLGTNGAGKSTLLRTISGLGFPQSGSVRFEGHDITFFGPDRRVKLGISQIPGGRAVFGPMTVAENLRVFGTSLGRDSNRARLGVDAVFEAFPILGERRNQRASSLSGGEQQMLGLGKAYLTMPKLLLIDELSLGLAPMVTAELVESVKRLNAQGIAVVLVEQSVNVALSLVNHAYFMEKGEIRFDGRATDLVDRPDLLRSIFLEGASDRLSATVTSDGHRSPTPEPPAGGAG